ncbi:MAG TPA: hypothetical protein PKE32_07995 [Miltoncostaeaceae bacterium]|nr:hypothetical protein [Miltoncostaeaceae bacterium]
MNARRLPPVTLLGMVSLGLVIVGGIYLAAHIPGEVPLAFPSVLLALSLLVLVANLIALALARDFNRQSFLVVGGWALLWYAISAGMIEYVFLHNGLRGGPLLVLSLSLAVYAIQVPVLIGFTVARYAEPQTAAG